MTYDNYRSRFASYAAKSPVKTGLLLAIFIALLFGLMSGLRKGSVGYGISQGLLFGVFVGVFMAISRRRSSRRSFGTATPEQRIDVTRAVDDGETTTDPALAPAVISHSHEVIDQWEGLTAIFGRILIFVGPIVSAIFLIDSLADGNVGATVAWAVCGASCAYAAFRMPRVWKGKVERARRAEAAAERQLSASG